MKLNHDCVRDVLLFVEEEQRPGIFLHLNDFISIQDKDTSTKKRLSMYDAETIKYTLMKLHEAGYLKDNLSIISGRLVEYSTGALTWEGHKFLDTIRDPKIWKTTKEVASHLESVSITLISNIASNVLENYIQRFIPKP